MTLPARRAVLVAAGVLAVFAGLVATFPARLALAWFAPPTVQAWGVEGTIWRGRAQGLLLQERNLGPLEWQAQPSRLLALQPTWNLELRPPGGHASGRVAFSLSGGRQTISGLEASLDLGALPPAIVPVGVVGEAHISIQRLVLRQGWPVAIAGRAAVGELILPGVIMAIGPFEFLFPDQADPVRAEIRSVGGPLEVDGRVELRERGQWHFSAELAPGENPPRELIDGLALVGEDIGNGRRRLTLSSGP